MANPFPEESIEVIRKNVQDLLTLYPADLKTSYQKAKLIADSFFKSPYGFASNLKTGNYAPHLQERDKENIHTFNCTTIIPDLYLYGEELGLNPEIVQFYDFKDIITPEDKKDPRSPQHFSLIIDVGQKHKYLLDPFYSIFGPIMKYGDQHLKLGENKSKKTRREFSRMVHYSPEEFVAMLEHVRTPAGSLDMLVAGQKVFDGRKIAKRLTTMMVYYDDNSNILSTRLYIPQVAITDKAIYCRMPLTDDGDVTQTSLELFLAKKASWIDLVDKKRIATVSFNDVYTIQRTLKSAAVSFTEKGKEGKKRRLQRYDRIGAAVLQSDDRKHSLLELADTLYTGLATWEKRKLEPLILMRTLYECTSPGEEYLYSHQEHDQKLLDLVNRDFELVREKEPLEEILYLHGWKLPRLERNWAQRLQRQKKRILKEKIKVVKDIDELNFFRRDDKKMYYRTMDKVLFATAMSDTNLEEKIAEQGLDSRLGYVAMVWDFIPFAVEGKKDITLELFRDSIAAKVKARRGTNGAENAVLMQK
ncbi:MAG: hypothetical protein Q8R37_01895 [Nanoarchaeota archaeon]|nr:hypothetical protein [Nanoarchaeota archaeon]